MARELALVGLNVNLAPVLDVPRSPACPQWDRAYSSDPETAARYAVAAIRGYMSGGIIPVAKHFPGLGDTLVDSHEVLPLAQSGDPQREVDLLPFRQAVAAGVPMVMTAHLAVPAWDERPATLSPVALQDWLRRRLGFDGVIITDDLEMGGISTKPAGAPGSQRGPGGGGRPAPHLQQLAGRLGNRPSPGGGRVPGPPGPGGGGPPEFAAGDPASPGSLS